jgi:hypothetical protein
MNERIRELIKQMDQAGLPYGDNAMTVTDRDLEYFAELIVRECARVQHKRFCEHGDVSWDILMEHFGVEE